MLDSDELDLSEDRLNLEGREGRDLDSTTCQLEVSSVWHAPIPAGMGG